MVKYFIKLHRGIGSGTVVFKCSHMLDIIYSRLLGRVQFGHTIGSWSQLDYDLLTLYELTYAVNLIHVYLRKERE